MKSGGLSNGAKAGLGAGVVVETLALACPHNESNKALRVKGLYEKDAGTIYKEAGEEGLPHEASKDCEMHEM